MKVLKSSLIAVFMFISVFSSAQDSDMLSKNPNARVTTKQAPDMSDYLFGENKPDYRIISSTASYVEIEYYPAKVDRIDMEYNGERFSHYEFELGHEKNMTFAGSPDLRYRSFAIMLPSEKNNSVQIIDYDVKEEHNINLTPIAHINFFKPNSRSFEDVYFTYTRNNEYTQNKYIPESVAELTNQGPLRDVTLGNLVIHPFQYNPVSKTVKFYSRIRVRVNFGETPVMLNRPRSREEVLLLMNSAINSSNAINWMRPDQRNSYRDRLVTNSVLSSGDWYKIEIKDQPENGSSEGMYKISKNFLESNGINLSGIDPRTIKLYGNGGDLLPESLQLERPGDLEEIAVHFEGENDGVFNNEDYILFYGKSIHNWKYDSLTKTYSHYVNYHSRSNYYWICFNTPNNGKRMQSVASEEGNPIYTPNSYYEKVFTEPEQSNLINEGNLWLSLRKNPGQSFEWAITLNGLEAGSDISYRVKLASRCLVPNTNYFLVKDVYSNMPELLVQMGSVQPGFYEWISTSTASFTVNQSQKTNGDQVNLRSTYYASNPEAEAYLDWYEIVYKKRFNSVSGDFARFDSPDTSGLVEYNISSFSNNNIRVFDATLHNEVKMIQPVNVTSSNVKFRKTEQKNNLSKYLIAGSNGYKTPTGISSRISNQNLRGISDGASFIIVTSKDFVSAAERLKTKREQVGVSNPDYLKTLVVTTDQIYNEFSGGVLDAVAIRDFIRHAYYNWNERPTYVCLFGDGSFDYKGYLPYVNNFVPAWELTSPVIHQVDGLTTDDFFVNVVNGSNLIDNPDLAVGRIPASSLNEANLYIDKIDAYESGTYNGYWKNRMMFVSDDEKTTAAGCEGILHINQIDGLAEYYTPQYIDRLKIYIVTYPTVITPQGRRKPQANLDIAKYWSEGVLNIHYTGHGSPDVWAHEYILEKDKIVSQISNENRYPFVSIASCDMSKFDNPANQSAGELFMMTPRKGAIGTLAASRPVYASDNAAFMNLVFNKLYLPRDTLLLQKRFGAAIFNAKQESGYGPNRAKYILMCDPTIRTQMPRFRSHIDSISGLSGDTMKALSRIKIYGSIHNPDSSLWSSYNGKIILKIHDVDKQVSVLEECFPPIAPHNFRLNGGIIYSGIQNITNGKWTAEFIVPKDISYQNQPGRLISYFFNDQDDGAGLNRQFIVGGINPNAPVDSVGPVISMYLNNRNFRSGDVVNENFKFLADLYDESGINTTGTLGHKLEGVLDGNENVKYDFTNFYNSDTSYQSGTIDFDFASIPVGRHTLKLKAWDTYNNSSEALIEFDVSTGGALQVMNVYNYPNPFKDNTAFTFHHNYPGNVNIKIKVYTVAGRLIKEIERQEVSDKFVVIDWDGKDEDGETLGNGVYIYRLVVESLDGVSTTNTGKLAVLK